MTAVMTFYRFVDLAEPALLQRQLYGAAHAGQLKGTVLIAREGINGTLAGTERALRQLEGELQQRPEFAAMTFKHSQANTDNPVFYRLKVKVKDEIVGFGQPGVAPAERTGEHVAAQRWNELLADPEVLVVDTRNDYEVAVGTFPGAVNPQTRSFREFAAFVRGQLDPGRHQRIAMFCTGGIRCEKASAFMLQEGFAQVYQLQGGVLGYLDSVAPDANRWQGECFVFDQRVSVDDALQEGSFQQCFACRRPLSAADRASPDYRQGVSCPHCIAALDDRRAESFAERNRQVALAAGRGESHIGGND